MFGSNIVNLQDISKKWNDTKIPDTPQFSVPQEMKFPQLHSTNEVGNARS